MTALNKLTDVQLLFRLQDFYGAEQDAIKINDHEYAQECSDIVSVIREVMESRKALEAAENRMTELESRVVALPRRVGAKCSWQDGPLMHANEVIEAIRAAGIGVKGV